MHTGEAVQSLRRELGVVGRGERMIEGAGGGSEEQGMTSCRVQPNLAFPIHVPNWGALLSG